MLLCFKVYALICASPQNETETNYVPIDVKNV